VLLFWNAFDKRFEDHCAVASCEPWHIRPVTLLFFAKNHLIKEAVANATASLFLHKTDLLETNSSGAIGFD
jgi:hypothetical protein